MSSGTIYIPSDGSKSNSSGLTTADVQRIVSSYIPLAGTKNLIGSIIPSITGGASLGSLSKPFDRIYTNFINLVNTLTVDSLNISSAQPGSLLTTNNSGLVVTEIVNNAGLLYNDVNNQKSFREISVGNNMIIANTTGAITFSVNTDPNFNSVTASNGTITTLTAPNISSSGISTHDFTSDATGTMLFNTPYFYNNNFTRTFYSTTSFSLAATTNMTMNNWAAPTGSINSQLQARGDLAMFTITNGLVRYTPANNKAGTFYVSYGFRINPSSFTSATYPYAAVLEGWINADQTASYVVSPYVNIARASSWVSLTTAAQASIYYNQVSASGIITLSPNDYLKLNVYCTSAVVLNGVDVFNKAYMQVMQVG
jgi:hypothetical protein